MLNDFEIIDALYEAVKGSALSTEINGEVCKDRRNRNSDKEDITFSVVGNQNAQVQEVIAYANIFVKDIDVRRKPQTQKEANRPRCKKLAKLAEIAFGVGHGEDFRFTLDSQRIMELADEQCHVVSNKIIFKILNE